MSHTCEECGHLCFCDIEDMEWEQPPDCAHLVAPARYCETWEPPDEYESDDEYASVVQA
jgi:hypothetical protein